MYGDDPSPGNSGLYPKNSIPPHWGRLQSHVDLLLAEVRSDQLRNFCKAYFL